MKKWLRISMVVIFVIFLSGCSLIQNNQQKANEKTLSEENVSMSDLSQENEVRENWADAVARGEKLRCSYPEENSMGDFVLFLDGEKYRVEYGSQEDPMVTLFDGKDLYSWNQKTKSGFFLRQDCMEKIKELGSSKETLSQNEYYESTQDVLDAYSDISCQSVSNIDVRVLDEISFTDQCSLIEMQMEQIGQIESLQKQNILPEEIEMMP
ncbi:MAG: hypothetical protein EOM19_04670 [Candidatus Moranbacteria bacterium]|nr:hypothetical protein [Candidatus Moranbacteria bacterium]